MTVYNTDTKCLESYKAEGSWLCSRKAPPTDRGRRGLASGSLFFTKDAYPVMGVIDTNGKILSGMGNFRVEKLPYISSSGGYGYKVTLGGSQKLLGVTASFIALNSSQRIDTSYTRTYSIKIQEPAAKNGFSYYIQERRSVTFIAFVSGDFLPDYARYLVPIGGKVNANGSIAMGSGFSTTRLSTDTYRVSPKGGGHFRFLTAAKFKGYKHYELISRFSKKALSY